MSGPQFRSVSPILSVASVDAAISFYESVLGFRLGWKWGVPASVASVCRNDVELMLELSPPATALAPARLYIVVSGLEAYCAEILAPGGVLRRDPCSRRDGHLPACGSRLRHERLSNR